MPIFKDIRVLNIISALARFDTFWKAKKQLSVLSSVTRKKCQMSIKVVQKMISTEKVKILTPLQKLPKNVGDLRELIVAKGFKKLPKAE